MAGEITATSQANSIVQEYQPGFGLAPNEELVVAADFYNASGAVQAIGNLLTLRKLDIATASTVAAGDTGTGLTYSDLTDTVSTLSPTFDYAASQIPLTILNRVGGDAVYKAAFKKQLVASLATALDVAGGALYSSVTTNVTGGGGSNLDQSLFLESWNKLIVSGKDAFDVGTTRATLVIYNKQAKNLMNIPGFTQANLLGETNGPLKRGWVNQPMNCNVRESGNIATAAGVAHSLLYLPMAFAKAWNMKPQVLDPQPIEAAIRIIAVQERGQTAYFEYLAVDLQTSDA